MSGKARVAAVLTAVALAAPHVAFAQPTDDEREKIAAECSKSYEDAQVHQNADRLLEAKEAFTKCAAETCPSVVRGECQKVLPDLQASIPTVVFDAIDSDGAQVIQSKVSVDGKPIAESIDGHAVPIDPGPHKVKFETAGADPVEIEVVILAGQQRRAVQGKFKKDASSGNDTGDERPFGVAPWIVAGAGAAILGTGIGLLVVGLGDISDAEKNCPTRVCAKQEDVDLGEKGIAMSTAGKVLIPVGAVAMAGSLVWQFVFNKKRAKTAVRFGVGPTGFGLTIDGRF